MDLVSSSITFFIAIVNTLEEKLKMNDKFCN